jgi:N-methylhydantoinase A
VTDANLVLGRLSQDTVLADDLRLDFALAHAAVERFAERLQLPAEEAALGILEIANSNMAKAVRVMTVERGLDPRDFTLLAFGGAGPMHACELAEQLGMNRVMVPIAPGVTSALGTMFVDIVHDLSRSHIQLLDNVRPDEIERAFEQLEEKARELLDNDLVPAEMQRIERSLDLRYVGQGKTLNCTLPREVTSADVLAGAAEMFLREYERRYQYLATGVPIELAVVRLRGRGLQASVQLPAAAKTVAPQPIGRRTASFKRTGPVEADVYRRTELGTGDSLEGPLIVEQMDSTTVIPPDWEIEVDRFGNLVARRRSESSA